MINLLLSIYICIYTIYLMTYVIVFELLIKHNYIAIVTGSYWNILHDYKLSLKLLISFIRCVQYIYMQYITFRLPVRFNPSTVVLQIPLR